MKSLELYEDFLEKSYDKKIVLFGARDTAMFVMQEYLLDEEIAYLCDNDEKKWGYFNDFEVYPPSKLVEDNDHIVVVITSDAFIPEIYRQLNAMGIRYVYPYTVLGFKVLHQDAYYYNIAGEKSPYQIVHDINERGCPNLAGFMYRENIKLLNENNDKISKVRGYLSDMESIAIFDAYIKKMRYHYKDYSDLMDSLSEQYFIDKIFNYSENEIFIDAGCFDGGTSINFAKRVQYKFNKIYCFEPDTISYKRSKERLDGLPEFIGKYEIYPYGLSHYNGKTKFNQNGMGSAQITENGSMEVPVCKLDDHIKGEVTFIKMDIEGSEYDALLGAKNIIIKYKPKLAICIYHRTSDLWEIPILIKKLVPEYNFFLKHHSSNTNEKVLYATL